MKYCPSFDAGVKVFVMAIDSGQDERSILKRLKLYELDYNNPDEPVVNAQLCILHFFVARSVFPVTDEETPIAAKPVGYEEHVH